MTLREHNKHSIIARPAYGYFGRNEWAIVGTPCGTIKALADKLMAALSADYKVAYVDAQHARADEEPLLPGRITSGAEAEFTDQIHYHQIDLRQKPDTFRFRQLFSEMDLVLVNGNHEQAKAQVVVIDETKKTSLQKRLSQLTNVQLFLLADNASEVFDFVKEAIPVWQEVPLYHLNETDKIVDFFRQRVQEVTPVLNGLVLAGGQSLRMGHDKGRMVWHEKEQRFHIADLLRGFCNDVYISCRPEQACIDADLDYRTLGDTFTGLGPYGAILSAFRKCPDAAWLVVACDLPLLDSGTLEHLVQQRSSRAVATTFESPQDGFPEPLITIWEPKSYPLLLSFLAQGYTCPRKVLRNSDINMLKPLKPDALFNVNTPEDAAHVKQMLEQKNSVS